MYPLNHRCRIPGLSHLNMQKHLILLAAVLLLPPASTQAAGDMGAGAKKAQICAACHGADGNSTNPVWPRLAGQQKEYILKQLHDFKNGKRANPQMSPMAANLGEEDMQDLAAYFSAQKISPDAADPALIESGQKLYRAGNSDTGVPACMACHGPAGHGNPASVYPAVGGQHAAYTLAQLKAFREKARTNDPNEVMRTIAGRMTDDEITDVAAYMQGLHAAASK
jgi:cytochrome c553